MAHRAVGHYLKPFYPGSRSLVKETMPNSLAGTVRDGRRFTLRPKRGLLLDGPRFCRALSIY